MSRYALAVIAAVLCFAAAPAQAYGGHHHGPGIALGLGLGWCCAYSPYYAPSYYYGYPAYYEPQPTVVYTTPSPPPQVTYVQPVVQPQIVQQAVPAGSASQAFTDSQGRTCRTFQTTLNDAPISGTACLQADGSWRTVGQ